MDTEDHSHSVVLTGFGGVKDNTGKVLFQLVRHDLWQRHQRSVDNDKGNGPQQHSTLRLVGPLLVSFISRFCFVFGG